MTLPAFDTPATHEDPSALDDISQRGLAIYERKLKGLLEPEHNGEALAIHLDSEDYALAPTTGAAMRAMRGIHPAGQLVLLKVGSEPEYGLAARLIAPTLCGQPAK